MRMIELRDCLCRRKFWEERRELNKFGKDWCGVLNVFVAKRDCSQMVCEVCGQEGDLQT